MFPYYERNHINIQMSQWKKLGIKINLPLEIQASNYGMMEWNCDPKYEAALNHIQTQLQIFCWWVSLVVDPSFYWLPANMKHFLVRYTNCNSLVTADGSDYRKRGWTAAPATLRNTERGRVYNRVKSHIGYSPGMELCGDQTAQLILISALGQADSTS